MELPEVASAARLSLRSGDRLVLSFRQRLTDEQPDRLRDDVKTRDLPDGVKVIMLDDGVKLEVLAREDAA